MVCGNTIALHGSLCRSEQLRGSSSLQAGPTIDREEPYTHPRGWVSSLCNDIKYSSMCYRRAGGDPQSIADRFAGGRQLGSISGGETANRSHGSHVHYP